MTGSAQTPLFIVSTGRSGSTMLSDLLALHPNVLSISELFNALHPLAKADHAERECRDEDAEAPGGDGVDVVEVLLVRPRVRRLVLRPLRQRRLPRRPRPEGLQLCLRSR